MILLFLSNPTNSLQIILISMTLFFVVLYQLDQVQVSNSSIMLLQTIYPIIFIFVDFLDFGTHYPLLTFIFLSLFLSQNFRNIFGLISQVALMIITLAHFTTTAHVPDAHVCHANQPEQSSNYVLLTN